MQLNDQISAAAFFERVKAEHAYKDLQRREARLRFAASVRTVWGERTFLFRISVLGLILGLSVAFLIPATYTSTARLMPPDSQSNSSLSMADASLPLRQSGLSQIAADLLGPKSTSAVFVGILNSRTLQDKIIAQFELKHVYGAKHMDNARKALGNRVSISVDRRSDMVTINVTDRSPNRAAAMANAYVDELNRLVAELSTFSARRERIFLEGFLVQVRQDLVNAEQEFSRFASQHNTVDISEQSKSLVGAAATLQGQLMFAQSELEALRQIYTDSNVRVRSAKARIEELQAQLRKLAGKDASGTVGPDTDARELYPSMRKLPLLGVTYADLYRRTKVREAVYEALTQEYDLAKVQEARDIPTVKVLDIANIPDNKSFPPRLLIAISSTLLALTAGVGLVLGSKSWNEKDPGDLGKAVATEIWIDLKEKRFLNSTNDFFHALGAESSDTVPHKHSIFSFLGWRNAAANGSDSLRASVSEEESRENGLCGSNGSL